MHLGSRIPDGFVAVDIFPGRESPLRIAALVDTGDAAPTLVQIRAVFGARVLLGALLDASGSVVEWVEIWIQQPEPAGGDADFAAGVKTNAELDTIWRRMIAGLESFPARDVVLTGYETKAPPPLWVNPSSMTVFTPEIEGAAAELCQDDPILEEVGLPGYATSQSRYLWSPALGFESPFIVGAEGSQVGGPALALEEATKVPEGLIPLNPHAGLIAVRRYAPMSLEQYCEVIGGADWEGPRHAGARLPFDLDRETKLAGEAERGIFLGRHGRWGRSVEALHLKLMVLADCLRLTKAMTRAAGRPMLGLTASSFRIRTPEPGMGLPALWACRATLSEPPMSIELRAGASTSCFLPADETGSAIYRPKVSTARVRGTGKVRIREVASGEQTVTIEATLATDEALKPATNDLVRIGLPIGDQPIEVYGRLSADKAMAGGEWRVRGFEQPASPALAARLKDAEGTTIEDAPFEVIPMLTTPCDLYSLAVIGARLMLVGSDNTLAVAMDELHSLAREAAELFDDQSSLESRIGSVFDRDGRWASSLGPRRLTGEVASAEEAFSLIPSGLWFRTLGLLVSMLPGEGPDSIARDFGDARRGGLHLVFDPAIERLERLLEQSRSLIVIDWNYNREISGVIRGLAAGLAGSQA